MLANDALAFALSSAYPLGCAIFVSLRALLQPFRPSKFRLTFHGRRPFVRQLITTNADDEQRQRVELGATATAQIAL